MINEEFNAIEGITYPVEQSQVLGILYTRIAAGLEIKEQAPLGDELLSASDNWILANVYLLELADKDPHRGTELAVALINMPENIHAHRERVNSWMRTSGLMLLGLDEMTQELTDFLGTNPEAKTLAETLKSYMNTSVSELTTPHDYDGNPKGYSTVQSVYIGLGLKGVESDIAKNLYENALRRMSEPDLQMAYGIVSTFPECAYLRSRV